MRVAIVGTNSRSLSAIVALGLTVRVVDVSASVERLFPEDRPMLDRGSIDCPPSLEYADLDRRSEAGVLRREMLARQRGDRHMINKRHHRVDTRYSVWRAPFGKPRRSSR